MEYILSGESVLWREDGTFTLVKDFFKQKDLGLVETEKFKTKDGFALCTDIQGSFVKECFKLKTKLGVVLKQGLPVDTATFGFEDLDMDAGFSATDFLKGVLASQDSSYSTDNHYLTIPRDLTYEFSGLLNSLNIDYNFTYDEYTEIGYFDFEYSFEDADKNIFACDRKARWSFLLGFLRFCNEECGDFGKSTLSFVQKVAATLHASLKIEKGNVALVTKEQKEHELANRVESQQIIPEQVYLLTFDDSAGTDIELWVDGFYVKLKK